MVASTLPEDASRRNHIVASTELSGGLLKQSSEILRWCHKRSLRIRTVQARVRSCDFNQPPSRDRQTISLWGDRLCSGAAQFPTNGQFPSD